MDLHFALVPNPNDFEAYRKACEIQVYAVKEDNIMINFDLEYDRE